MTQDRSPTVERVVRGDLCSGCGLCAGVSGGAITMDGSSGYNRPVQSGPISAAAERAIAEACPGVVVADWPEAPNVNAYWGPWRRVATGHSTDEAVRFKASSGGALTALALHALRSGLVDRVAHVLPDPRNPTGNIVTCSSDVADIIEGAGSRYAASSPLEGIERLLADGGAVAFVGKPCDVSALRRLGRLDPRVAQHVPLALAFFCAGVPNQAGVRRILKSMSMVPEEVESFRYRGQGWPGQAVAVDRHGRTGEMTYAESWGDYLAPQVQFRCKICPDAVGGSADIACADAWESDAKGYPILEERDGRSLIMARTAVGERFLDAAVAAGALTVTPLPVEAIDGMQPSQAYRKRAFRARTAALAVTLRPAPSARGVMIHQAASRAPLRDQIKNFLGTVRRVVFKRR